ncbi:MAG: ABC transporter ATP-binding protein [Sphingobacteriales bacterium]|nr:ABC transporter ATP-binding protein [Sphingobacteriales bacterium]
MITLKVDNVSKSFDSPDGVKEVLAAINFALNKGEIIGIRGENGSGKTTLFNIIAGIESTTNGGVSINRNPDTNFHMGVVFQNYNSTLLPWLSVKDNICIPLKISGLNKEEKEIRLKKVIDLLKFNTLPLKNYPHQLSGGQRQRVAIARALIQEPGILILDEPFSNLDFQTSLDLQDTLQEIHTSSNIAILVVSHNIDHILYLADRVLVLGEHPSKIVKEFVIDIPRPRKRPVLVSAKFEDMRNKILEFEYAAIQKEKY